MNRNNSIAIGCVGIFLCLYAGSARAMTPQQANIVIWAAESQLGVPYLWGAESPGRCFDCSGLTQWAFTQAGIFLPRQSFQQIWVCHYCVPVGTPGALMFYSINENGVIDHVGLDLGRGYMIDADSLAGRVVVETYNTSYWRARLLIEAEP